MSSSFDQEVLEESQTSSVARMLELAGDTADRLVSDAGTEAESLVSAAQAKADAILAKLNDEKEALEAQIAALREMDRDHRGQMRQLLTDQISALDATLLEPPAI